MAKAYPSAANLKAALTAHGFAAATITTLEPSLATTISAAIADLERETGRKFLWTDAAQLRKFDPPSNREMILFLPYDLCSVTSMVYQTIGGSAETLTEDTDYVLEPYNHAEEGIPAERVRFLNRRWPQPLALANRKSIQITGKWAWGDSTSGFPDSVWEAMVSRALWRLGNPLTHISTQGLQSASYADETLNFGTNRWSDYLTQWDSTFQAAVWQYKKRAMVL